MFSQLASKKILVTGHTGFKGVWLCLWLQSIGAEVSGIALAPEGEDNLHTLLNPDMPSALIDLRDREAIEYQITKIRPEVVFHLGAQSLVRRSYTIPIETFATNVMGTLHVLEAVRRVGTVQAVVNVTTDKCYQNHETGIPFVESDPMGGYDPYSASKGATEIASHAYRQSFLESEGIKMATARAGNVIGGGDFSEDRLIPDAVRAIKAGSPLVMRAPDAIRPWQHVLDVLQGYMLLAEHLLADKAPLTAVNIAPLDDKGVTVHEMVTQLYDTIQYEERKGVIQVLKQENDPHEATMLRLDATLAHHQLGWQPRYDTKQAVDVTAKWYEAWLTGQNMRDYSHTQLMHYQGIAI